MGQQLVERLIGGTKAILVGLMAAQEVKGGKAPRDGLPDACRKQDNPRAEVSIGGMIAGVGGRVRRPIGETPQGGNRYTIGREKRQIEPALRPELVGDSAQEGPECA